MILVLLVNEHCDRLPFYIIFKKFSGAWNNCKANRFYSNTRW